VAGVLYVMLKVHVAFGASGVVNEQVVAVTLNRFPVFSGRLSAVIRSEPVPVFVTVTTLVTAARGDGMVNVRVRTPATVDSVPLVAEVKLSVPGVTPVPVSATGEPVTVVPAL
jgi:hypothetical protein